MNDEKIRVLGQLANKDELPETVKGFDCRIVSGPEIYNGLMPKGYRMVYCPPHEDYWYCYKTEDINKVIDEYVSWMIRKGFDREYIKEFQSKNHYVK